MVTATSAVLGPRDPQMGHTQALPLEISSQIDLGPERLGFALTIRMTLGKARLSPGPQFSNLGSKGKVLLAL